MLKSKKRWVLPSEASEDVEGAAIADELRLSPLVGTLLKQRGITNKHDAYAFLHPEQGQLHSPLEFREMEAAVQRIHEAIHHDEHIRIYGDYDADGVTSTAVLVKALESKGANVDYYIPHRFKEGYGPHRKAFEKAADDGVRLLITVDNGISGIEEIEYANELGLTVILTDHHEAGPELPNAFATIHPSLEGETYPFQHLAGVGVAVKLAEAVLGELPQDLLGLAAIGTIADLVPLLGENRVLVAKGLKALQNTKSLGLQALMSVCQVQPSDIDEEKVGFALGPRLNALGRLGDANPAVALLLTNDDERAEELARLLDDTNKERQQLVRKITNEAVAMVKAKGELPSALVLYKEDWNPGVVGIVASRLVEQFYRPCILLGKDDQKDMLKGSARSVAGFHLFDQLSKHRDILPHFGGHAMAAGLSLAAEDIEELERRLQQMVVEEMNEDELHPTLHITLETRLEEVTLAVIKEMEQLRPFGMGNPKPLFSFRKKNFAALKRLGVNQQHLKLTFADEATSLEAIGFQMGSLAEELAPTDEVELVGELSINEWNGSQKPQVIVRDLKVADWQLFDWRGLPEATIQKRISNHHDIHVHSFQKADGSTEAPSFQGDWLLWDVPKSIRQFSAWFDQVKPGRIYLWGQPAGELFETMPSRERFKWLYTVLLKHQPVDWNQLVRSGNSKGVSEKDLRFLVDVFIDLQFVKQSERLLSLVDQPEKKDIQQSSVYQARKEQLEAEEWFCTSSSHALKDWMDKLKTGELKNEEAVRR
ncbi:single-stranded-DNA-specific exonuclease RecJ [Bacillaceae bacterium SIJ1]|uniref:single-stranded-DNA-specific exonuclease RecJ n=1 Tax=Litoribacterium kuwaitense TaxID=1398745 RepID=UPI0013E99F91|nr:single-stranded-DNA-specific exonuclease RecJ [Litoribacterium kuwaitense]NGP43441.1 single-stranded-DNA-specific exonuclease RecJ [Litoribacterium kuwaitense]